MITNYTDFISLAEAKNYLRIDSGVTEDDAFITSMITASLQWIEQYTNHIIVEREKEYFSDRDNTFCGENIFMVYDYPVESVVDPVDPLSITTKRFNTKTRYTTKAESITLNLGYNDVSEVPEAFKQAAESILQVWYYNSEKTINDTLIPTSVKFAVNPYRRFPLF